MKKKIVRMLLLLLVLGLWSTSGGCSLNGKAVLTVTNTGPATLILSFLGVTTKLESGTMETYDVTMPSKKDTDQILTWYPLIHPSRRFYEYVVLQHDKTTSIELYYDPQNPPPDEE